MFASPSFEPLPRIHYLWEYFSSFYQKLLNQSESLLQDPRTLTHDAIAPTIEEMSELLRLEGTKQPRGTIGECLEFFIDQEAFSFLCAYGKTNQPPGMLILITRALTHVMMSYDLLLFKPIRLSIFQILTSLAEELRIGTISATSDILFFLRPILFKLQRRPHQVESFIKQTQFSQSEFTPVILLQHFLTNHRILPNRQEVFKNIECLLKIDNSEIITLLQEPHASFLAELVTQIAEYIRELPLEIESDKDSALSFWETTGDRQLWKEFQEYLSFFDRCLHIVARNPEFVEILLLKFFQDVLIGILQDRILEKENLGVSRTALQILLLILQQFTFPTVLELVYSFLFGFPQTQRDEEAEESPTFNSINNINSSTRCKFILSSPTRLLMRRESSKNLKNADTTLHRLSALVQHKRYIFQNKLPETKPQGDQEPLRIFSPSARVSRDDDFLITSPESISAVTSKNYSHEHRQLTLLLYNRLNCPAQSLNIVVLALFDELLKRNIPQMVHTLFLNSFSHQGQIINPSFKNREAVQIFHKYSFLLLEEDVRHYMGKNSYHFENYALNALQTIANAGIGAVLLDEEMDSRLIDFEIRDQAPSISQLLPGYDGESTGELVLKGHNMNNLHSEHSLLGSVALSSSRSISHSHSARLSPRMLQTHQLSFRKVQGGVKKESENLDPKRKVTGGSGILGGGPIHSARQYVNRSKFSSTQILSRDGRHGSRDRSLNSSDFGKTWATQRSMGLSATMKTPRLGGGFLKDKLGLSGLRKEEKVEESNVALDTAGNHGVFLNVLLKKLQSVSKHNIEENLLLTSVLKRLTAIPCSKEWPESFLLHYFLLEKTSTSRKEISLLGVLRHLIAKMKEKLASSVPMLDSFVRRALSDRLRRIDMEDVRVECYSSQFEKPYQEFLRKNENSINAILVLSEFVKEISAMKWQKTLVNSMLDAYKEVQVSELDALDDEPDYEFAEIWGLAPELAMESQESVKSFEIPASQDSLEIESVKGMTGVLKPKSYRFEYPELDDTVVQTFD